MAYSVVFSYADGAALVATTDCRMAAHGSIVHVVLKVGAVAATVVALAAGWRRWRATARGHGSATGRNVRRLVNLVELDELHTLPARAQQPRKVAIVGVSGAGKSWLAEAVSARLGLRRVDLDEILAHRWRDQRRAAGSSDLIDMRQAVKQAPDGWVADGVYTAARIELWTRAHLIVLLEPPPLLRVWRVLRRTLCLGRPSSRTHWLVALGAALRLSWYASGLGPQRGWLFDHLIGMQEQMAETAEIGRRKRAEQSAKGQKSKTSPIREAVPILVLRSDAQLLEWLESLEVPARPRANSLNSSCKKTGQGK